MQSQSTHSSDTASRRRRKIKTPWIVTGIIVIVILGFWLRARSQKPPEPQVKTAVVGLANVKATVSGTGTLEPITAEDIKARVSGIVTKMAVEAGTVVKKGQLICIVDQQDALEAYELAKAAEDAARAAWLQAQGNERLQKASIGPQILQAAGGLESAQAKVTQSQATLDVEIKTSKTDVQQAESNVKAAQAKLDQAKASNVAQPKLTQAAIDQAKATVAANQATLDSAEQALKVGQNATLPQQAASVQAQVDQAKSDVQTAQLNLQRQQGLLAKGYVAQTTVDTAQNQLVVAQSSLKTAQAQLDTLKGQQTAQLQGFQAQVQTARGTLQQSQAALQTAQANSVQNEVAQQNVATAAASVKQMQAALASAIANLQQVEVDKANVVSAQALANQASAALKAAQANTIQTSVQAQVVAQDKALMQAAHVTSQNDLLNLHQTKVLAPHAGIILQKYIDAGTIIQSGQGGFTGGTAIVSLGDVSRMYVTVNVDEADIANVRKGEPVSIVLDAYPNSPKRGVVRLVYPEAVVVSNVTYIPVWVDVNPKDVSPKLLTNMTCTCNFTVAQAKNVLAVPADAIKYEGKKTVVTVIKDPQKPLWEKSNQKRQVVQVGVVGDDLTQIRSGLKKGDIVVTQIVMPAGNTAAGSGGGGRGLGRF